jgi:ribokinase
VLLTLGAHGALLAAPDAAVCSMHGHALPVVDTTGAGDTFAGVFAAACAEGLDRAGALRAANAAAALSCGARGAQAAQPERAVVERFLRAGAGLAEESA